MRHLSSVRAVRDALTSPPFDAACSGATREAVAGLEVLARRVTGLETPVEHVEFLRLMGGGPPPVAFAGDADSTALAVSERYAIHLDDDDTPPLGCVLVAVGGLHVETVVIRVGDGSVWSASGEHLVQLIADSWLGLLNRRAFQVIGQRGRPAAMTATGVPGSAVLDAVLAVLIGSDWLPWRDSVSICAVSPDERLAVVAEQYAGEGGWLLVSGVDRRDVRQLVGALCRTTDLQVERSW